MSYRLYNEDVAEGLVDFNDQKYHILKTRGDYTLVFNDCTDQFIVAYKLQYHALESIDWAQGHYFSDIIQATQFLEEKPRRSNPTFSDEAYSWSGWKAIGSGLFIGIENGQLLVKDDDLVLTEQAIEDNMGCSSVVEYIQETLSKADQAVLSMEEEVKLEAPRRAFFPEEIETAIKFLREKLDMVVIESGPNCYIVDGDQFTTEQLVEEYENHKND